MKAAAAVLVDTARPLELADLELPALAPGQALVELRYSGVCHTQLLEARGRRGRDPYLPHCLGHEGVGVVREVSPGVRRARAGDTVVLSWMKADGYDVPGTIYRWRDRSVNAGGVTTFNQLALVSENRMTPIPTSLGSAAGALLGCALPTGMGAVIHTAGARAGQSIVIFGAGGVGLCAVVGATVSECHPVVAVDLEDGRLALAAQLGATHVINVSHGNSLDAIAALCPGGADIAIEATGRPAVMAQALSCVRPRGGAAVVLGNAHAGEVMELDPGQLNQGKRLLGAWGGDTDVDRDLPRYARMIAEGRINLEPLLGRRYALGDVNAALNDLESGVPGRPIIDFSLS